MSALPHPIPAASSRTVRALPALGLVLGLATLVASGVCLDALVLHDVALPVTLLAFVGAAIGLAGLMRAGLQLVTLGRTSRALDVVLRSARPCPGRPGVLLVSDPAPAAWCAGLLRPRVLLSAGATAALSPRALDALVAHERHHAQRRDGLRRGLLDVVAAGLFLAPEARQAGERYATALELDADHAARRHTAGAAALAEAMLALDRPGHGVEPERVDHLLGLPVRVGTAPGTLAWAAGLLLALAATTLACTLATGCVDIFLLREDDATAGRFGLLPVVALAAALIATRVPRRGPARG